MKQYIKNKPIKWGFKYRYRCDSKTAYVYRFYLRLFFDLLHVALVNSFIVYKKLGNKGLTLKEFKICIALKLIASFISSKTWPDTSITIANRQDDDVLYAPK